MVHPCVLEGDTHVQIPSFQPSQMLKGPEMVGRKVRFRPPTESFHLCHYSSKTPYGLPVRGIYQMQVRSVGLVVGTFEVHSIGSGFTVGTLQACCEDANRGQAPPCVCKEICCRAGTVGKSSGYDATLKFRSFFPVSWRTNSTQPNFMPHCAETKVCHCKRAFS